MMYQWRMGAVAWLLHRVSGIGVLVFLGFHIWTQTKVYRGQQAFNEVLALYQRPIFKFGEIVLMGAVIYHALNGIRIAIVDFANGARYHKKLFWTLTAIGIVMYALGTYSALIHM